METGTALIGLVATVFSVVAFAGVLARGRYRHWFFFAVYLAALAVSGLMIATWPKRFYVQEFWVARENLLNALRFGVAAELAFRTFRGFPGALSTLRWTVLLVLLITLAVVWGSGRGGDYRSFVGEMQPRIINGSIWLFTAIAAMILWYRLPVRAFYKAVLVSYVPYLLIFTVTQNILVSMGWERAAWVRYANQLAFLAMMVHWSWAAWRTADQKLQPPASRALQQSAA